MKKLIAIILALLFLVFLLSALAESTDSNFDLDSMSTEELLTLKERITTELYKKGGMVSLPSGEYLVGRDIAAGSYIITFLSNTWPWGQVELIVYNSPSAKILYENSNRDFENKWDIYLTAIRNGANDLPSEPQAPDFSEYYTFSHNKTVNAGKSFRITVDENQLLFVNYEAHQLFAIIEKAPTLFFE